MQPTHAAVDADADAPGLETVLVTALIGRRTAGGLHLLVLLEQGVDDLFGRVATHVLIQQMDDEQSVRLQILINESEKTKMHAG